METLENGGGPRNIYTLSSLLKSNGFSSKIINLFDVRIVPGRIFKTKTSRINTFGAECIYPGRLTSVSNLLLSGYGRVDPYCNLAFSLAQKFIEPRTLRLQSLSSDALIATSWRTVRPMITVSEETGKRAFYFVQADEATFSRKERYSTLAKNTYFERLSMFTHSKVLVEKFREKYGIDLEYIGYGINTHDFVPGKVSFKKQIFTIARFEHFKGFDTFVRAINLLYTQRNDFEVVIAGSEVAVRQQDIRFPYKFLGWISRDSDLAEQYRNSIFVNTGRDEALPMPPLEAMACGSAVVATDLPGIREYAQDGVNCFLVPVDAVRDIASIISMLLDSESQRSIVSSGGIETASRYNWDVAVKKLIAFIKSNYNS